MNFQHRELAAGRWNGFTLCQQMGNIGSEVERTLRARENGNAERATRAMERALELFDLTLACPAHVSRLKEIARAREIFLDFVAGENEYASTAEWLRRYYTEFGTAARLGK